MVEDKKQKHRSKPNRMSDVEIMVIPILFHSGGFRCLKHYNKKYVCTHLKHLFPRSISHNRFVELEKEGLLPLTISSRKSCWRPVQVSVLLTLQLCVSVITNVY